MSMTVRGLIRILQDFPEEAEVRLAHQPQWAFEYSIGDVVSVKDVDIDELEEDIEEEIEDIQADPDIDLAEKKKRISELREKILKAEDGASEVVYIGESNQIGYLSEHASRALGWSRSRR